MKILLFGKNGQVGWELQRSLAPLGELIALDRTSPAHCGDLENLQGIRQTIRAVRPDVIVNAAAYTAVDRAESDVALCHKINALAPEAMALEAAELGAWMVHYSSDYVFDGSGDMPRRETDAKAPINAYGESKAQGEERVAAACARHLLLRTSWVYGQRGENFATTMLRLGVERDRLTVVADQHGAPTGADLVADVTAHVLRTASRDPAVAGIYHLVPRGETTWHAYAAFVLEAARAGGMPVRAALEPVPSTAYKTAARRPHNSRLNNNKLEAAFGLRLPDWQHGVERMLAGKVSPG